MVNVLSSVVACKKCLDVWVDLVDNHKYGEHPNLSGLFGHLDGLIDKNANHLNVCKGCSRPLGGDRMVGGDGLIGCDVLGWRWHEKCFYGRFGYFD
jgi:hypothetical protein